MNDGFNHYGISPVVRYALAGAGILVGLVIAVRTMEKEREKLLEEHLKKVEQRKKNKRKHHDQRSLLSRPVDEVVVDFIRGLQERCNNVRTKILLLSYWGRIAVLVTVMAFYCCILVYFKLDETNMRKERKALYEQVKNAVQSKIFKKTNNLHGG